MPERFKSKDKKPQKSIKTVTLKKKEKVLNKLEKGLKGV